MKEGKKRERARGANDALGIKRRDIFKTGIFKFCAA